MTDETKDTREPEEAQRRAYEQTFNTLKAQGKDPRDIPFEQYLSETGGKVAVEQYLAPGYVQADADTAPGELGRERAEESGTE